MSKLPRITIVETFDEETGERISIMLQKSTPVKAAKALCRDWLYATYEKVDRYRRDSQGIAGWVPTIAVSRCGRDLAFCWELTADLLPLELSTQETDMMSERLVSRGITRVPAARRIRPA